MMNIAILKVDTQSLELQDINVLIFWMKNQMSFVLKTIKVWFNVEN